jgi:hypothetical protein
MTNQEIVDNEPEGAFSTLENAKTYIDRLSYEAKVVYQTEK